MAPLVSGVSAATMRAIDLLIAVLLIVLCSPALLARALWALVRVGRIVDAAPLIGRNGKSFSRLRFAGPLPGRELAALFNVIRGDLAFAGPRPLRESERTAFGAGDLIRFDTRPGLVSPFRLRSGLGIAYDGEGAVDREFVVTESVRSDLGLLARAIPAMVLGSARPSSESANLDLLGVSVDNMTMGDAVDAIASLARSSGKPGRVSFVNPDCLNIACRSASYRSDLATSDLVLPDGVGLRIAGKILGHSVAENVNGTDMYPRLCERAGQEGLSIYLLGARPGVAAAAAAAMQARTPSLRVAGTMHGYFSSSEEEQVVDEIARSGADIVLVALGAPRQEQWIRRWAPRSGARVLIGVGGLFDFYSGRIPRAPVWVRELGLEWAWRLAQEPGRLWRRYVVGNPLFLIRIIAQRLGRAYPGSRRGVDHTIVPAPEDSFETAHRRTA